MNIVAPPLVLSSPIILRESDTAYLAARMMMEQRAHCILICDSLGRLTGIMTARDLVVRVVCAKMDPTDLVLKFVMTKDPVALEEGHPSLRAEALWLMRSLAIHFVPIIDSKRKPIGLLAADALSLLDILAKQPVEDSRPSSFAFSYDSISPEEVLTLAEERAMSLEDRKPKAVAHAEQTLGKYIRRAVFHLETRNVFAMERPLVMLGLQAFLKCLVRRVMPSAADHFIAQLPRAFQEILLAERFGPDRMIDRDTIVRVLEEAMGLDEERASAAMEAFAMTISEMISEGEVKAFRAQLPEDLRRLFSNQGELAVSA